MEIAYFSFAHLTLCYVVPLLVIIVSYVLVGYRIWRRHQIPNTNDEPSSVELERRVHPLLQRTKVRALRMVAIVVAAFALAWLPLYTIFAYIKFNTFLQHQWVPSDEIEINLWSIIIPIAQWISCASSCINPFLYHFFDPRFRFRFRQLLSKRQIRQRHKYSVANWQNAQRNCQRHLLTINSPIIKWTKAEDVCHFSEQ
jgi:hypothetical protein